jgi:contact-dependent growth inhibition (CDI) system restriction endonuclease-like protein
MIHRIWRLSETSAPNNLGLACTDQGLLLGRTPLIERRDGRFVVRERSEIERLLSHAYRISYSAGRIMPGLATVAAALNADDQGLARIAAVHLRLPDLPDHAARDGMEAMDVLLKYARDEGGGDWNPALHPRAGTPPNPGWFAPTDGDESTRTAQNDDPTRQSDAAASAGQDRVRLRPGPKRIDELADFAEWFANATSEDEAAIRAEIKRYFADVGWEGAAHDLNAKLDVVLRPGVSSQTRQKILDSIDLYTRVDPAEYVGTRDILNAGVLAAVGLLGTPDGPSPVWKLGWAERGRRINKQFGDNTFPDNYPTIDKIPDGAATSVKSMDLNAATYQNEAGLTYRLENYVTKVREFEGAYWGGKDIRYADIDGRAVHLIVPKGSMTEAQRIIIERVRERAMRDRKRPVDIIITEF